MTSESAESAPADAANAATAPAAAAQAPDAGTGSARKSGAGKSSADKPRAGVPVWRIGKPDAFLASAVDVAREAVATIAGPGEIGAHLAAKSEGDRVVTHLFESRLAGYLGWQWYAVVTRNSRSKVVTVSELGLLPSEDSILAPEWIPWAKRVRPEDETPAVAEQGGEQSGEPAADEAPESLPGGEDDGEDFEDEDFADDADEDDDETGAE